MAERCEDEVLHSCSRASDSVQGAHEWMGRVDLVVTIRTNQQHVPHIRLGQQIFEQIQGGRIEPLQIVEEEGQRMLRSRENA